MRRAAIWLDIVPVSCEHSRYIARIHSHKNKVVNFRGRVCRVINYRIRMHALHIAITCFHRNVNLSSLRTYTLILLIILCHFAGSVSTTANTNYYPIVHMLNV